MTSKQQQNGKFSMGGGVAKRLLACFMGVSLSALLWVFPFTGEVLNKQTRLIEDYFVRNDHGLQPRKDLVFLGVDADSMQLDSISDEVIRSHPVLDKMSTAWPWDRSVHAAMIDRLAGAGAKLIVVDLIIAQRSSVDGDKALAEAIARHRDKIVLSSAFIPGEDGGQMRVVEPLDALLGPLGNETAIGFVNFWPHAQDGIVRRAHFYKTLSAANHADEHPDEPVFQSLASVAAEKIGVTTSGRQKRFRMARIKGENADQVYKARSYYTVFVPEIWESRYANGNFFKDKIVFIGPASPLFQDSHDTPSGPILGAQLHMHVLTALLEDAWYSDYGANDRRRITMFVLLGLVLSFIVCFKLNRTWIIGAAIILGGIFWFYLEQTLVDHRQRLIGSMASLSAYGLGLLCAIIWQAMSERARRQQLHRHLRRSMSPDVADAIIRAPEGYYKAASGNRREVTVLFTDIRGFTHRSEEQDAGELFTQLNTYLERMVEVIFSHGGTVDKFIGDAIMATWGELGESDIDNQLNHSVLAAQKMLDVLGELNKSWEAEGLKPFRIGVGIHHGEAIVGEVGSDQRTDFTVIGDAVNLASRIEGLTKALGVDLLVSATVAEKFYNNSNWIYVAKVRVMGRDGGVSLWTPASVIPEENTVMQLVVNKYTSGDWVSANELLEQINDESHFAGVAKFYRRLLFEVEVPAPDWDGVITIETK